MSAVPHQREGTELEKQEGLFRGPTRLIAAAVIAAVIVMMSALLAFITVPPQPLVLLLGILIAGMIYWAARATGRSGLIPGGPHEEQLGTCASCGSQYCVKCHERCPQCGSVHIRPNP